MLLLHGFKSLPSNEQVLASFLGAGLWLDASSESSSFHASSFKRIIGGEHVNMLLLQYMGEDY